MSTTIGAEALCCKSSLDSGYALDATGASASLSPVNTATPRSKTITARDVAFPLADPYSPVTRAGVPVPGLNAWPDRANRLGRRYYGFDGGLAEGAPPRMAAAIEKAFAKPTGFAGLGAFEPGWDDDVGLPPVMPPIGQPSSNSGGINWDTFFGGLFKTLPPTISAITGRADPLNRTQGYTLPPVYNQQYGTPPDGYSYNSSGQLVKDAAANITDFISTNPLLVGGAILGVVLLFTRPPSRR